MKKVTVNTARQLAKSHDLEQVILMTTRGATTTVTTYGKTKELCLLAADSGNNLKAALGWPEELCNEIPPRLNVEECDKTLKAGDISARCCGAVIMITSTSGSVMSFDLNMLRALTWKLRKNRKDLGWLGVPQPPSNA